jgi:hypothetical protein
LYVLQRWSPSTIKSNNTHHHILLAFATTGPVGGSGIDAGAAGAGGGGTLITMFTSLTTPPPPPPPPPGGTGRANASLSSAICAFSVPTRSFFSAMRASPSCVVSALISSSTCSRLFSACSKTVSLSRWMSAPEGTDAILVQYAPTCSFGIVVMHISFDIDSILRV